MQDQSAHIGMLWKLRRVAARLRQQDVAAKVGVTTTRLSSLERGEDDPTEIERQLIERFLPPLPGSTPARAR